VPITITGAAQWQAWQDRALPPVERVAYGLWSIPVPIPDNPLRYVLVYAIEAGEGLILVDAGWHDDASWQALTTGLESFGSGVCDVTGVLVTHFHGDHLGLAGRIREASGAWIAMHELDAAELKNIPSDVDRWFADTIDHLEAHGVPVAEARNLAEAMDLEAWANPPLPDRHITDGEIIRARGRLLRAIWTPGHTPGHTCFYDARHRQLFSGDHVLPRITPQISVFGNNQRDALGEFLHSLSRLDRLAVGEVLPAHEYRFRGLSARVAQIADHHTHRLVELLAAARAQPGATAWELAKQLSWSRPWAQFSPLNQRFALGETLSHLTLLERRGDVRSHGGQPHRWHATRPDTVQDSQL
jgi:glyoxylase-like metal-dependent hydrolase (beta-lactamase superfamily II)